MNEHTLIVLRVRLYSQGLVIIWGVFGNTERHRKNRGIGSTKYTRWECGQSERCTGDPPGEPRSFSLRWVRKQDTFQVKQLKALRSYRLDYCAMKKRLAILFRSIGNPLESGSFSSGGNS